MDDVGNVEVSWNLLVEPWIPVVKGDGAREVVSLRGLFEEAPDIREISGDCPQQTIVLIRLALAILYRAYCNPDLTEPEMLDLWVRIWLQGRFDIDVVSGYLDKHAKRFDLFGDNPFMQVKGLSYLPGKEPTPISELIADVPKKGKFLFSMRGKDHAGAISFAEAARWLVFFQAYDIAGTKGAVEGNTHIKHGKVYATKDKCGTGLLGSMKGVFLGGRTLFETLMLNWVLYDEARSDPLMLFGNENDLPSWEREAATSDTLDTSPEGPASLFTWQSRRVRLISNLEGSAITGVIYCYGDITALTDMQCFETMCAWREDKKKQKELKTPYVPWAPVGTSESDSGRALWRGLNPILGASAESKNDVRPGVIRWGDTVCEELTDRGEREPILSIWSQGIVYGTGLSCYWDAFSDYVDLHAVMLRSDSVALSNLFRVFSSTDQAVRALGDYASELEQVAGCKKDDKSAKAWRKDVEDRAYGELDVLYRKRIADFTAEEDAERYCRDWCRETLGILKRLGTDLRGSTGARRFSVREEEVGAGKNKRKVLKSASDADRRFSFRLRKLLEWSSNAEGDGA